MNEIMRYGLRCYTLGVVVALVVGAVVTRWPSYWWLLAAPLIALGSFMYQKAGALRLIREKGTRA